MTNTPNQCPHCRRLYVGEGEVCGSRECAAKQIELEFAERCDNVASGLSSDRDPLIRAAGKLFEGIAADLRREA